MEDRNNVVIAPRQGEVAEILNASNGASEFALVVEVFRGHRFLVIYEWEEGWEFVEEYQLGFFQSMSNEVDVVHGVMVDIGISVLGGETVIVLEEVSENGHWVVLYGADREGFWEILDELMVEPGVNGTSAEVSDEE